MRKEWNTGTRLFFLAVSAGVAIAAPAQRGTVQDLDVIVFVEEFEDGFYEAYIEVAPTIDLQEVRIDFPGKGSIPFDSFDDGTFEFDIDPDKDTSIEDFLTSDATGEFFDLQFVLGSGAVSVYRFDISQVFGPQINTGELPGFATGISADQAQASWQAPSQLGDALVVRGARPSVMGDSDTLFVEVSPLPFAIPLLVAPPPTLMLSDTSVGLTPGSLDETLLIEVSYLELLGSFTPSPISGPALSLGNTDAVYLSYSEGIIEPATACPADLNGDDMYNFFDVSAFLTAYNMMDPVADFNGDSMFNFFDVSAFLTAYNAGCP